MTDDEFTPRHTHLRAIPQHVEDMQHIRQAGEFLIRGDGLMQFPVGQHIISIGFGPRHVGSPTGESVEVAIFTREGREFATRGLVRTILGHDPKDDVAVLTPTELASLLHQLTARME